MSAPARSVFVFGCYLLVLGAGLVLAPDLLLAPFGFAPSTDVWVHVTGMLVLIIGGYYLVAARAQLQPLLRATVYARLGVLACFGVFSALHWGPAALLLFGAVDAAGAVWTALCLRRAAQAPQGLLQPRAAR